MACREISLPTLTPEEEAKVAVRALLHQRHAGVPLSEVIAHVSQDLRVTRSSVKAMIWDLYSDGYLELTANWDLREAS